MGETVLLIAAGFTVSFGFRALLCYVGLRERERTGGDVPQARRGLAIYLSGTVLSAAGCVAGLVLLLTG